MSRDLINEYISRFGREREVEFDPLNEQGFTTIARGSATVRVNVLDEHGVLLLLAPVMPAAMLFRPPLASRTYASATLASATLLGYWGLFTWLPAFLSAPKSSGGAGGYWYSTPLWARK